MYNEIFTIAEVNQYKFEAIVNTFLKKKWSIMRINMTTVELKAGWSVLWSAIMERKDGIGEAKIIERRAIEEYLAQKEER